MTDVDVRGLPCPRPVVETKKALDAIAEGTVRVLVDNPESRDNVRRFAESQGCSVEVSEGDGVFRLSIVKGEAVAAEVAPPPVQPDAGNGDAVVLVGSSRLGVGDERLGDILMKAFLNTLWDYTPRPARLLFINSGVFLTTEGSEALETIQMLEREGVQVFSCGTCLEFYGITDRLRVGLVTNMYDTVDSLLSASRVVRI